MSDRLTVMISCTARDLPAHREQVRLACERAGFAPHDMMEHLTAQNAGAVEASLEMVENADIYLGIYAHRYGYVPDGSEVSITEMEYDHAGEMDKPRLAFFMHDDHHVQISDVDKGESADKLEQFKERVGKELVVAFFTSPEDLRSHVIEALVVWEKAHEADAPKDAKTVAESFHRHTAIPEPPEPYVAHPYTLSQVRDLVGRQDELNAMTDWVATPGSMAFDAKIFCFVAIGGMGKSAVTWKWFQDIAPQEVKPLAGRLWWSFYESDSGFENFLNRALCYVSNRTEDEVQALDRPDREAELLRHLTEQPFLLVLDGLERLLLAYHRMDASSFADDNYDAESANIVVGAIGPPSFASQTFLAQPRLRQTIDRHVGAFLRKLAQVKASRILITSRLYPSDLQNITSEAMLGFFPYELAGLSDNDAVGLWRALGVSGSRQELVPMFRSFDSHPLLVQALASEVARDRNAPGEFAGWKDGHPQFDPTSLPLAQRKFHILHHALTGLDGHAREVLTTLVAFRIPATFDTLEALLVGEDKTNANVNDLDWALTELEDRGLIGWDREANRYDTHPIVRGVVWQLVGKQDQDAIYAAMEAYFEPMVVREWEDVTSLDDLASAIQHYHTLVELRRYDDAVALFRGRLENATHFRVAAHQERIAWLEALFPNGVGESPALTEVKDQCFTLNALAISYEISGQPGRAKWLYSRNNALCEQAGDKRDRRVVLANSSEVSRVIGDLRDSVENVQQAIVLNRALEYEFDESVSLEIFGLVLGATGEVEPACLALRRSQNIFLKLSHLQYLGVVTASLAELSLWHGDICIATVLADRAWALGNVRKNEQDFIRAALLQGKAALGSGDIAKAEERLHYALSRARAVNAVELELPALVAITALMCRHGDLTDGRARLDDVWDAAERGPYPLFEADAFNVLADIALAENDREGAINAANCAYRAAWCNGPPFAYHWGLEKAKSHLEALGAPAPDMPPFDESNFEPMPEVEINPKDENWVDPDEPISAVLEQIDRLIDCR